MELGLQDIRTLIEMIEGSSIGELSFESGTTRISLKKGVAQPLATAPSVIPSVAVTAPEPKVLAGYQVKAPMVGTFYSAPSPDSAPYVQVGDRVEVGQPLCIIEAMKLMNEIEAEASGVVREVLAKNAQSVEFGQPLFTLELD